MRKRNLLFGRECSLLLDLFVSTKIHPREIKINDMCNRFSKTLSRILCKWKQDSVVSLFLYLDSVFKNKRLVSLGLLISLFPHVRKQFPVFF